MDCCAMSLYSVFHKSKSERLVIFTFGLLFSKGMITYVLGNLMTFLSDFWNLGLKDAAAIVNLQEGLRDMLQIYVAPCIDAFLGYRRMLILSGLLYSVGLGLLAFSVPQYSFNGKKVCPLEKFHCFETLKHTPFWGGLTLLILGGAAQVIPLDSLSFGQTKAVKGLKPCKPAARCYCFCKVQEGGFRTLWERKFRLFCIGFMMLGTVTSISTFISSKVDWHQHFLISAIAIVIGLLWFLCGCPLYHRPHMQPSPISTLLRVLVAAVRKRHLDWQENPERLHYGDEERQLSLTDHLEWLNKAAVKESTMEETRWTLCTVEEVEQTKLLLNMIPMSVTFIVYGMVKSLGNTFFVVQANSMTGVSGIPIVVLLQMIQWFSQRAVKSGYKMVFEKRIERNKRRYSDGVKIGLGMLAALICCAVASSIDSKRLKALVKEGFSGDPNASTPISAFWLVPQFFFLGAMEGLAGDGIKDFFGHYVADSRRYGPVFTRSLTGLGALLNVAFIVILDYYGQFTNHDSWVGDSINHSRLDNIYRAYVIVALLNCFLYAYVASRYSYDNIIGRPEEEEEIPFLEVKEEETAGEEGDQQNNQGQVEREETAEEEEDQQNNQGQVKTEKTAEG